MRLLSSGQVFTFPFPVPLKCLLSRWIHFSGSHIFHGTCGCAGVCVCVCGRSPFMLVIFHKCRPLSTRLGSTRFDPWRHFNCKSEQSLQRSCKQQQQQRRQHWLPVEAFTTHTEIKFNRSGTLTPTSRECHSPSLERVIKKSQVLAVAAC